MEEKNTVSPVFSLHRGSAHAANIKYETVATGARNCLLCNKR